MIDAPGNLRPDSDQGRRGFIARSTIMLAGLMGMRPSSNVVSALVGKVEKQIKVRVGRKDLAVTYVPTDYLHFYTYTGRLEGFGGANDDVAIWYKTPTDGMGWRFPLEVHISPRPGQKLGWVKDEYGQPINVTLFDGQVAKGVYFNGGWIDDGDGLGSRWITRDLNHLVFELNGMTVGLRGGRRLGADQIELARVATGIVMA